MPVDNCGDLKTMKSMVARSADCLCCGLSDNCMSRDNLSKANFVVESLHKISDLIE